MCLRDGQCDGLLYFEKELAHIASRCEITYGYMGAVGFLYESAKDRLKWENLDVKYWINIIMDVGRYVVMDDKTWQKEKLGVKKQSSNEMGAALLAAFGDGK